MEPTYLQQTPNALNLGFKKRVNIELNLKTKKMPTKPLPAVEPTGVPEITKHNYFYGIVRTDLSDKKQSFPEFIYSIEEIERKKTPSGEILLELTMEEPLQATEPQELIDLLEIIKNEVNINEIYEIRQGILTKIDLKP
jgi:hypothetical protein